MLVQFFPELGSPLHNFGKTRQTKPGGGLPQFRQLVPRASGAQFPKLKIPTQKGIDWIPLVAWEILELPFHVFEGVDWILSVELENAKSPNVFSILIPY